MGCLGTGSVIAWKQDIWQQDVVVSLLWCATVLPARSDPELFVCLHCQYISTCGLWGACLRAANVVSRTRMMEPCKDLSKEPCIEPCMHAC